MMFRLKFRRDPDANDDVAVWSMRVQDAAPMGLRVAAAYVDAANLVAYVEGDTDDDVLISRFADRLALGPCSVCAVEALRVVADDAQTTPIASAPNELRSLHPAELLRVSVAPDGHTLSVKVRHKPYEQIDRVDAKETDDTVELTVWVGSSADDARRRYVTLAEAFSTATVVLDQPLGTRSVVEPH